MKICCHCLLHFVVSRSWFNFNSLHKNGFHRQGEEPTENTAQSLKRDFKRHCHRRKYQCRCKRNSILEPQTNVRYKVFQKTNNVWNSACQNLVTENKNWRQKSGWFCYYECAKSSERRGFDSYRQCINSARWDGREIIHCVIGTRAK